MLLVAFGLLLSLGMALQARQRHGKITGDWGDLTKKHGESVVT